MKFNNEKLSEVVGMRVTSHWAAMWIVEWVPPAPPSDPVVQKSSLGRGTSLHFVFTDPDTAVPHSKLPLADNILIYGVGCREAKDKSSDCNRDNPKDD